MHLSNDQLLMLAGWTAFAVSEVLSWSGCDSNGLADVLIALGKIIKRQTTGQVTETSSNATELPVTRI